MRKITISLTDKNFDEIEKYRIEQFKKLDRVSISSVINRWLFEYINEYR